MRSIGFFLTFSFLCFVGIPPLFAKQESPRYPAVAGAFYPKEKDALSRLIESFLAKVKAPSKKGAHNPSMLIVPHAGFVYSGQTAAYAYKLIEGLSYDTVVMLGPCHRSNFSGASVWRKGQWETPLGAVDIDTVTAEAIVKAYPAAGFNQDVHRSEHSLETQVPFLQMTLKNFKIVPILVNDASPDNCRKLARAVLDAVRGKRALILVSTDMSHYYPADEGNKMDKLALELLEKGDGAVLRQELTARSTELCGAPGVLTALEMRELAGGADVRVLEYADSSRASGDTSKVVGYGAVAYYFKDRTASRPEENSSKTSGVLPQAPEGAYTDAQKQQLLEIARLTVDAYVKEGKVYEPEVKDSQLKEKRAAFVTLRKRGALRGCIGGLMPQEPLYQAVRNMAIESAVHDPRFRPVSPEELKEISIEISVLTVPVKAKSADEVVMGTHGVIVKRGFNQGVFLPKVADETGWSKEEFLNELCSQKAGLPADAWKDPATELYIFSAEDFKESDF